MNRLVLTNNPQNHIIKPCNVNKTWICKTAVKTSENTKQNLQLKIYWTLDKSNNHLHNSPALLILQNFQYSYFLLNWHSWWVQ